jgi:hypothetical protein
MRVYLLLSYLVHLFGALSCMLRILKCGFNVSFFCNISYEV